MTLESGMLSARLPSPGFFVSFGEVSAHCFTDLLRNWRSLSLPSEDQFSIARNVLEMGFDLLWVLSPVRNKYALTGTYYLSESELISDLLQLDWEENSVKESRGMPDLPSHALGGSLTSRSLDLEHCWDCPEGLPPLFLGWN